MDVGTLKPLNQVKGVRGTNKFVSFKMILICPHLNELAIGFQENHLQHTTNPRFYN